MNLIELGRYIIEHRSPNHAAKSHPISSSLYSQPPPRYSPPVTNSEGLLSLPDSVLVSISNHLDVEFRAAFALVNKRTLFILVRNDGNLFGSMVQSDRRKFLRLIDRDLSSWVVYCLSCDILHDALPKHMRQSGKESKSAGSTGDRECTMEDPNLTHAVMRQFRAGRDYEYHISVVNSAGHQILAQQTLRRGATTINVKVYTETGQLLMKKERLLPLKPGQGSKASVRNLYEIGWFLRWTPRIYHHRNWDTEYPFLLPRLHVLLEKEMWKYYKSRPSELRNFSLPPSHFRRATEPLNSTPFSYAVASELMCTIYHSSLSNEDTCHSRNQWLGVVRSCDQCDTDFCLTTISSDHLLFSAWGNLGSGQIQDDTCIIGSVQQPTALGRASKPLWPFRRLENLEDGEGNGLSVYKCSRYAKEATAMAISRL